MSGRTRYDVYVSGRKVVPRWKRETVEPASLGAPGQGSHRGSGVPVSIRQSNVGNYSSSSVLSS